MRILVAEDSAVYQRLISGHLREWGFDLTLTANGSEAWQLLEQPSGPKLALLDWMLPGMEGTEICRKIRNRNSNEPYIYTVLLTAKNGKQDLLDAMEAGADDFLAKPFDKLELRARLFAGKRILALQEQLVSTRESLRFAATHDPLTGMWNRAEVLVFLSKELARAKRERVPVGIALADLDHFKQINDSLGHVAGDAALRRVAKTLCRNLRIYDGAGRYGGEEFLLVLPGCDLQTMLARGEEIRRSVANSADETSDSSMALTISIGVIEARWNADLPVGELLSLVDRALYRAKRRGRNRVESISGASSAEESSSEADCNEKQVFEQGVVRVAYASQMTTRVGETAWINNTGTRSAALCPVDAPGGFHQNFTVIR